MKATTKVAKWLSAIDQIVAVDLETAGLNSQYDQILQISAAIMDRSGEVVSEIELRLAPTQKFKISYEALAVQAGDLTTQEGRAKAFDYLESLHAGGNQGKEAAQKLREWSDKHKAHDLPVVAHNASFDWGFWSNFTYQQRTALGKKNVFGPTWIDTKALATDVAPGESSYSLNTCLAAFGLGRTSEVHNALEDAKLAGMLFFKMTEAG